MNRDHYQYKGNTYVETERITSKKGDTEWYGSVSYKDVVTGVTYNRDLEGFDKRFVKTETPEISIKDLIDQGFRREIEEGTEIEVLVYREEGNPKEVVFYDINSDSPETFVYDNELKEQLVNFLLSGFDSIAELKTIINKVN